MKTRWCMAAAVASIAGLAIAADVPAGEPKLDRCLVSYVDEADVPAREAGVLVEVLVREGDVVRKGMPIARINDEQPQREKEKAEADFEHAKTKAGNDVNIRFAAKNQKLAETEYKKNAATNLATPGTKTEIEMLKLELECDKAVLQKEQAEHERTLDEMTVVSKGVEVRAANDALKRRLIESPLDGEVRKVDKHLGEWMQPGERLAHVVRLDTLRVEGMIRAADWNPDEMEGREVTVEAELERGRREKFQGRITFVSQEEQSGGEFLVRAEVTNRRGAQAAGGEGGWLLRAGKQVKMTIHTSRPAAKR